MFVQLLFLSFHVLFLAGLLFALAYWCWRSRWLTFLSTLLFSWRWSASLFLSLSTLGIRPWGPGNHGYDYDSLRFNDFDEDIPPSLLVIPFSLFGC